jgi:hypothetical protein
MTDTPAPRVRMNKRLARALSRLARDGRISEGSAARLEALGLIQADLFTGRLTITADGRQHIERANDNRKEKAWARFTARRAADT